MSVHFNQTLLHHCVEQSALRYPEQIALTWRDSNMNYRSLAAEIDALAGALVQLGLKKSDRVAIYLPKQFETVISIFACSKAGLIFVPVNPLLKREQVAHILQDSGAKLLITGQTRLRGLTPGFQHCVALQHIIVCDAIDDASSAAGKNLIQWSELATSTQAVTTAIIDTDPLAIFYTSGSTGLAKGVLLSHRNMLSGAQSVVTYLNNRPDDVLLALLPLSFDYGFSQLSSAMLVGARLVLMEYLLPQDVVKILDKENITGLAAVPSLWLQLSRQQFPETVQRRLRYLTNSGGHLPVPCLRTLQTLLPHSKIYLMYGLTEAFRSTYLDPDLLDQHPTSIGSAIPNAEVLVLREDGSECEVGEAGELVHRGSLVAMGYWNDPELTAQRFRPIPARVGGSSLAEIAVWSGDTVKKDAQGLLYFIARRDEMIKTSGYRVSPGEIEWGLQHEFTQHEFAAFAIAHPELGQAIVLAIAGDSDIREQAAARLREDLPKFMQPQHIVHLDRLPLNNNNKVDRKSLSRQFQYLATDAPA